MSDLHTDVSPLSFNQESMWFIHQLAPDSAAYNLANALRMRGAVDHAVLERALSQVLERHDALRSRFPARDGKPTHEVNEDATLELALVVTDGDDHITRTRQAFERATEDAHRPFELAIGPLARAALYRIALDDHLFVLTIHHIVVDGWSVDVIMEETASFYEALVSANTPRTMTERPEQVMAFARWERETLAGDRLKRHLDAWRERLQWVEDLTLPTDKPRPSIATFAGGVCPVELPASLVSDLDALCERERVTLFMALLAAFQVLLARYSHKERFAIGVPMANRGVRAFERVVGFLANSVPIPADLSGQPTFSTLLQRVRDSAFAALEHEELPFELLVDRLAWPRRPGANPLFQVMFALQRYLSRELRFGDVVATPCRLDITAAHFDLELQLWRHSDGIRGFLSFSRDLFEARTAERIVENFQSLLTRLVAEPHARLSSIPLVSERQRLALCEWGGMSRRRGAEDAMPNDASVPFMQRFAQTVSERPDATAVHWVGHAPISYGRLWDAAVAIARHVRTLNENAVVGVCLPPSPARISAIIGVLLAGRAVQLLDPAWPVPYLQRRLAGEVSLLVTVHEDGDTRAELGVEHWSPTSAHVCDPSIERPSEFMATYPLSAGQQPALVVSCGAHRVSSAHSQLSATFAYLDRLAPLYSSSVVGITEDALQPGCGWAFLWPLCRDACLVVFRTSGAHADVPLSHILCEPRDLPELCSTGVFGAGSVPTVLCMGEPLDADVPARARAESLIDLFAPPESPVIVSASRVSSESAVLVPAGQPPAWPLSLRDRRGAFVPAGVPAEIFVGPDGEERSLGRWGRWRYDGALVSTRGPTRTWVTGGAHVDADEIEAMLLDHPDVVDVRVLHARVGAEPVAVAYVVTGDATLLEHLQRFAREQLPRTARPRFWVQVSSIPVTQTGEVDDRQLQALAVVDARTAQRVQRELLSSAPVFGTNQICVVAAPRAPSTHRHHLEDLLPAFESVSETDVAANPSRPVTAFSSGPDTASAPLAYAAGEPLKLAGDAPRTLTDALLRTVERYPERGLTLIEDRERRERLTYAELLVQARRVLSTLHNAGITAGDRVILQLNNLRDHFSAFWACVLGGITPVTVARASSYRETNSVVRKLFNIWQLLGQPAIVTSGALGSALGAVPGLMGADTAFRLVAIDSGPHADTPPCADIRAATPTDVLFLQLTSGSTGIPKCIQITHGGVVHHVHGSALECDYRADDISLNFLPMDHVVPILTFHLKDTYLGIEQIHVKPELVLSDALLWLDLMETFRVTHTWAPNFGFKLVSDALVREPDRQWDLSCLKRAMNAGEQVTLSVITDFLRRTAPFGVCEDVMQPAFGMAEVCTCMTYQNDHEIGRGFHRVRKDSLGGKLQFSDQVDDTITFVDLGPPMPGVEIRITDAHNRVVPEGVIGRFQIRGQVTTPGYLDNEAANREAFVGDDWFNSGDLGFIQNGRLSLTGREKEMIIVRGANFYCYEIEDVVNRVDGVLATFSAASAFADPATGTEGLAIFFVPERPQRLDSNDDIDVGLLKSVRDTVARNTGIAPAIVLPLARADFPKTTSGKIQRTRLKKALAQGDFDSLRRRIDLAEGTLRTLPAWFYTGRWQLASQRVRTNAVQQDDVVLILMDHHGLGVQIQQALSTCASVVFAEPGATAFTRIDTHRYRLNECERDDHRRLIEAICEQGKSIRYVISLTAYSRTSDNINLDYVPTLSLIQALCANRPNGGQVRLVVAESVGSLGDGVHRSVSSPLAALVKSASAEHAWLDARHISLGPDTVTIDGAHVLAELSNPARERAVRYDGGRRYRPRLRHRAPMTPQVSRDTRRPGAIPIRRGGVYVLTGGLGGIGTAIATALLERFQARLVLVGRTPVDELGNEARCSLDTLRTLPGEVVYRQADVTNQHQMQCIVNESTARWGGSLDGVLHLAGLFRSRLLVEESADSIDEILAARVSGARVLGALLPRDGLLVLFGSVNGFFGAASAGAYAIANAYLERFAEQRIQAGFVDTYCLSWSMWDEIGMSRGYPMKERTRSLGFFLIDRSRGVNALFAALAYGERIAFIGLDGKRTHIRRLSEQSVTSRNELCGFVVVGPGSETNGDVLDTLRKQPILDEFGRALTCRWSRVDDIPRTASGDVDIASLLSLEQGTSVEEIVFVAPRSRLERQIAGVWRDVLGREQVGVDNTFFELGGDSLLLTQLLVRLNNLIGCNLTVMDVLRYSTIAACAGFLSERDVRRPSFQGVQKRARQAAARRRNRARRRK